ncbi:AsmA family protein [Salinimicrobium catena]|uniref:AsmA family protein n=1 Tax=Salinimicrobium catena TaxID=390640 RepID=A0A1H5GUH9_9FLAO|nr:AsmA-like C-terminal region-containing protein [Salinimicrobium catena]SDK65774.1 AsmA family protein [Salinimicrobium catena]SEE19245.1 AsmA family protein [Salinimicrobium catena]
MKKFLKIAAIAVGVILLILLLTPILFEKQLKDLVQKTINENLNAQVAFADIDLSLFRNFPDATLGIEDLSVVNNAPFAGDTLAFSEEVVLQMSVMELFRDSGKPLRIDALKLNRTLLNIKVDSLGNNNYDIAIEDTSATKTSGGGGFEFDMQHYEVNDSRVSYYDKGAGIKLLVEDLNHKGNGDLSAQNSTLSTFSSALVSLVVDEVKYLNRNKVQLEADFMMDLENQKYSFLENEALINQLPLTFDGYVKVNEDNNEVDITFKTPSSSFKNFLAVIPEEYSKNIEEVETSGDFVVNGFIRGIVDETYIPKMEININSDNASFKYPDLPKKVEDITIAAEVMNTTGLADDTYVNIDTLNFRIDQDAFRANGKLRNLTGNMLVDMAVKGSINLANLEKAYPLELEQDLNGMVTADMSTSFDMESIEKEQYQNVQSNGIATIRNFSYSSPEIPNEIKLATATMKFNSGNVALQDFLATTGSTDLAVNGNIQNFMGYMFTDQKLKGNFTARSKSFSVNDFMVKEKPSAETESTRTQTAATAEEAIKIPSFLDVQLDFVADQVLYDNLVLKNAKGKLAINNETASLQNVTASIFNGSINLNGNVSTGEPVPTFGMKLDLNSIDIAQAFRDMELLRNLAPIAQALQGNLSTNLDLRGNLNEDLTPKLQTLAGNALAEVLGARVKPEQTPLLAQLDQNLNFIDLNNLNLKDLRTNLTFNNGQVEVQPFDFNIKGIKATASGSHGFDQNMRYNLALKIPAKYLGDQLGSTLSKLSATAQDSMTVALPVDLTGTFNNPRINLNMEQAVSNLTQKIIASQTEKLQEKGKGILTDIITGKTGKDTTTAGQTQKKDSVRTQEEVVKEAARDILGGILGGKKKKKDTTNQ